MLIAVGAALRGRPSFEMGRPRRTPLQISKAVPVLAGFGKLFLQHLTRRLSRHAEIYENFLVL